MMSFSTIKSAGTAAGYYSNQDNYYVLGSLDSRWEGKGADELGLSGPVDNATLTDILQGRLPDGSSLSRKVDGKETHRPGYDLTFSAPKSVSMMALIGGDRRLIDAHDTAVSIALQEVQDLASARVTVNKVTTTELTGNIIAAVFNHDTSRDLDPQLHSHALIMNATKTDAGWRALSTDTKTKTGFSEAVMANQVVLGNIYRRALRPLVEAMGYETRESGKNGLWEMTDVPTEIFSQRSQAINDAVGDDASPKSRDVAALDTRKVKAAADPAQLLDEWQQRLKNHGFDIHAYRQNAEKKQLRQDVEDMLREKTGAENADSVSPGTKAADVNGTPAKDAPERDMVGDAVTRAISILSENTVRFTYSDLLAKSASQLEAAPGIFSSLRDGIETAIEQQRLIPLDKQKGIFTSDIHLLNELSITSMSREHAGSGRALQFDDKIRPHDAPWSNAVSVMRQDKPMLAVMEGQGGARLMRERIVEVMDMARDMGREVSVLAADRKSAQWLGAEERIENRLLSRAQFKEGVTLPVQSTLIIDQAEKLSLKETLMLLEEAQKQSAQLIFMDTGKRQGTGNALDVLKSSDAALYRWEPGKQAEVQLVSMADKRERYAALSEEFATRSGAGESVVAQVNGVREQQNLTASIRRALTDRGVLGEGKPVEVLSPVWLTTKTRRLRENYREGMVMEQWNSEEKSMTRWSVKRVGDKTNTLTLAGPEGETQTLKISQLDASWSLYKAETINVAPGDRLNVTGREEKGQLKAGAQVQVTSVSEGGITVMSGGKDIALSTERSLKLAYGYVESLGSSVSDHTRVLAAAAKSDMSQETLKQVARSGEQITLYTALDEERARTRLENNPLWRLASQHVKDIAGEQDLDKAMDRQKEALISSAEMAVRFGANIAQAEHRSGIVFSSVQLLEAASKSADNIPLADIKSEINRQVREGELMKFDVVRGAGVSMMVQRASYEMERSIVRHIAEGKGAATPLMQQLPDGALDGLTAGQKEATQLILSSEDRFIAIQGYAGVGKTTQLKSVLGALDSLPQDQRPEVIGLAPTHRAVHEMQSVGVKAQTLASFIAEEKQKAFDGEVNRYAGKLFLVDESSMIGNRDMAEAYQLIATGGGRAVLSGDTAQLKSPESGVPFAMQQSRSPIDVAVMKDIVRQTPALKSVVYRMIEGNHRAALAQVEKVTPDMVPRKDRAWVPDSSVMEFREVKEPLPKPASPEEIKMQPENVIDAVANDYAGRTLEAQRATLVVTQTNDDRNDVNSVIHALRHKAGETGEKEYELQVLSRVNTQKDALRSTREWSKQTGRYAFLDNAFWMIKGADANEGIVRLGGEDGQERILSVRENSTRDASIWETKAITVSVGDRLRFAATDNERGYVSNSTWDIASVDDSGKMTLKSGDHMRVIDPQNDIHDRRIDLAYAVTTHGSQGASERYSISLQGAEGKRGMLATQDNAYVQLSRAKEHSQVYTDNRDKWLARMSEASHRLSAHDILEADSDRARDTGSGIYSQAIPTTKISLGLKLLRDAGIEGDFKGRFVNSSAKYPVPHMALPLWDANGRDAGVLLTEIRKGDGKFTFSDNVRRVGGDDGRFAGFQHSRDGKVVVVTSYSEAIQAAQANTETGILIRAEGEGIPWNLQRIMGGKAEDRADTAAATVAAERKDDPIPFIPAEDERRQKVQEKKAVEQAAEQASSEKMQDVVKYVAGESCATHDEKQSPLPVPDRGNDTSQDAVAEVARQNLVTDRMQQIERELVRDKTLGE